MMTLIMFVCPSHDIILQYIISHISCFVVSRDFAEGSDQRESREERAAGYVSTSLKQIDSSPNNTSVYHTDELIRSL